MHADSEQSMGNMASSAVLPGGVRRSSRIRAMGASAIVLAVLCSMYWSLPKAASAAPGRISIGHLLNPGYLTVGSDTTYPPMEFPDSKHHGRFIGADVDLANALAKAMGLKGAKIVNNSFDTIISALQRHKFDVIMSSLNDTPDRAKQIAFVDYMRASEAILVSASSTVTANSYAGLCGRSVSVEKGTTELAGLQTANKHCTRKIRIKGFGADTAAFQYFLNRRTDAYTGDLPVAAYYIQQHPTVRFAGRPIDTGENYGIGVPKNAGQLRHALQGALRKIRSNGQYAHILNTWGLAGAAL